MLLKGKERRSAVQSNKDKNLTFSSAQLGPLETFEDITVGGIAGALAGLCITLRSGQAWFIPVGALTAAAAVTSVDTFLESHDVSDATRNMIKSSMAAGAVATCTPILPPQVIKLLGIAGVILIGKESSSVLFGEPEPDDGD